MQCLFKNKERNYSCFNLQDIVCQIKYLLMSKYKHIHPKQIWKGRHARAYFAKKEINNKKPCA